MPEPGDPLAARCLDALRSVAATYCDGRVPSGRVYPRPSLDYVAARDGCPAVVVAWTPSRPVSRRKSLQWQSLGFAATALLVDAAGGTLSLDPAWRSGWSVGLADAADRGLSALLPECVNVDADSLTVIDASAFEAAGLWTATCSLLVVCRRPLP